MPTAFPGKIPLNHPVQCGLGGCLTGIGKMYRTGRTGLYSARAQDCPQEMERNEAAPRHSWARQHAWLLLSFFPFSLHCALIWSCLASACICVFSKSPMLTVPLLEARTQSRLPRSPLGSAAVSVSAAAALVDGADVRLGESGAVALHQVDRVDVAVLAFADGPRDAALGSKSRGAVGPCRGGESAWLLLDSVFQRHLVVSSSKKEGIRE